MRIPASYFFVLCCAPFVLWACSVGGSGPPPHPDEHVNQNKQAEQVDVGDGGTTTPTPTSPPPAPLLPPPPPPPPNNNNEPPKSNSNELLSEEWNEFYKTLPKEFRSGLIDLYKKKTTSTTRTSETTEIQNFYMFGCANSHMKSDTEKFYPEFEGKDAKYHKKAPKKSYYTLMQGVKEQFEIPIELEDMISEFGGEELQFDVAPEHQATFKMRNYYYDMCGYLSRCNVKIVKPLLTGKSYNKAEALMSKIIKPGFSDAQKKAKIIEFAMFYARIRHWSNRFAHDCIAIFIEKGMELAEEKGRKVALYEILDSMKMLVPLRFSQNDLDRLNLLKEIIYNFKAKKYFSKSYEYLDLHNETITILLPFVSLNECH